MARLRVWLDSADVVAAAGVVLVRHLQRLAADPDIEGSRDSTSVDEVGVALSVAAQIQDRAEPS